MLFLFAGKAHPADEPGQQVLREIRQLMTDARNSWGAIVFLEDYDLQLARWLVSGVDVWLNNPIAPLEASGTSGIKAAINGRLNLSVLDGWWAEGWMQDNGWGIPPANVQDPERRDALEAELILDTLEEEVVPLYYDAQRGGLLARMGASQQARDDDRDSAVQHAPRAASTTRRASTSRPRASTGVWRPSGFAGASTLGRMEAASAAAAGRGVGLRLLADVARATCRGASGCGCASPRT